MPIRKLTASAAPPTSPPSDPNDDFSGLSLESDTEDLDLENYIADEEDLDSPDVLQASDDDDEDPEGILAGNFSSKVSEFAKKFFGEVSIMNQIRSGEAYIEVSPAKSPALMNSRAFGRAMTSLGLSAEWDGDDKVFKVKTVKASVTADADETEITEEVSGSELYDLLVAYFGVVPEPTDAQFHSLALALNIEPDELEAEVYRLMAIMFNDDADSEEVEELADTLDDEEDSDSDSDEDEEDEEDEEDVTADVQPYTPAEGEPDGAPDQDIVNLNKTTNP